MSIIPITIYGDSILKEKTKKVEQVDIELIKQIQDMSQTMRNANGIGLAANQVGLNKSVFIVDLSIMEDYEDFKPVIMINPEIVELSDELSVYEEGCLSLPNLRADVERSKQVKIKYLDTDEKEQIIEADNLFARVILHEYDHLIGKMIPDRVTPELKRKLKNELLKIMHREVDIDYPVTEK